MAGRPLAIFIVSGPSGAGKTSVVDCLLKTVPNLFFSISYTTRAPRAGEQDGREYRFVSRERFNAMIAEDGFLEYANVFGNYYGTHRSVLTEAERQGRDLLLDIDVQGAAQVKRLLPDAVAILLVPPSAQELERRLRARELDSPDVIQRRLATAQRELERYDAYDYLVVNRSLEEACAQVEAIVVDERHRRGGEEMRSLAVEKIQARAAAARREANLDELSGILQSFGARAE